MSIIAQSGGSCTLDDHQQHWLRFKMERAKECVPAAHGRIIRAHAKATEGAYEVTARIAVGGHEWDLAILAREYASIFLRRSRPAQGDPPSPRTTRRTRWPAK
jgi:hypothetical protein